MNRSKGTAKKNRFFWTSKPANYESCTYQYTVQHRGIVESPVIRFIPLSCASNCKFVGRNIQKYAVLYFLPLFRISQMILHPRAAG